MIYYFRGLLLGDDYIKNRIMIQWTTVYGTGNDFITGELELYRLRIYKHVIDCARSLIIAMEQLKIHPEQEANQAYYDFLLNYSLDSNPKKPLELRVTEAINTLWQDPCMSSILEFSDQIDFIGPSL